MKSKETFFKPSISNQAMLQEREEHCLTLRKKKLENTFLNIRLKKIRSETDLETDLTSLEPLLPDVLVGEFDMAEDKFGIILNFLKGDFSVLQNYSFLTDNVLLFALIKLKNKVIEEDDDNELFYEQNKELLLNIFKALIDLLKTKTDLHMLYQITYILINLTYSSSVIKMKMLNTLIWKRLYEISQMNQHELNANIIWIFKNIISEEEIAMKIFDTIDFEKMFLNYIHLCNANLNNTPLGDLNNNLGLVINLLKYNKTFFVSKLSFLYPELISLFQNLQSYFTLSNSEEKSMEISTILALLTEILFNILRFSKDGEKYLEFFYGESFIFSIVNLIKQTKKIIQNVQPENLAQYQIMLSSKIITNLYKVLANLVATSTWSQNEFLNKHGIVILSEEILLTIKNMDIHKNIYFFFSNAVLDDNTFTQEMMTNSNIPTIIKQDFSSLNTEVKNKDIIIEILYLIRNSFYIGDDDCKEKIIKDFYEIFLYIIMQDYFTPNDKVVALIIWTLSKMICFLREKDKLVTLKMVMEQINKIGFKDKLEQYVINSNKEEIITEIEKLKQII